MTQEELEKIYAEARRQAKEPRRIDETRIWVLLGMTLVVTLTTYILLLFAQ